MHLYNFVLLAAVASAAHAELLERHHDHHRAANAQCSPTVSVSVSIQTVMHTVTVTAGPSATTSKNVVAIVNTSSKDSTSSFQSVKAITAKLSTKTRSAKPEKSTVKDSQNTTGKPSKTTAKVSEKTTAKDSQKTTKASARTSANASTTAKASATKSSKASSSTSTKDSSQTAKGSASTQTTASGSTSTKNPTAAVAGGGSKDDQKSLTLNSKVIQANLQKDGQGSTAEAGQVRSLTSSNNFINFCLTQKTVTTNGLQTKSGSCNPIPMGRIIQTDKMPSSKFVSPKNTDTITANKSFTIKMAIKNVVTGSFTNPKSTYFNAPAQVDASGTVIGHSHVVIEKIDSLSSTKVTDPNVFAFFKGLNGAAEGGVLSTDVTGGLPAGFYRLSSINAAANHQPILGAVAQHGSFDDWVYFTAK